MLKRTALYAAHQQRGGTLIDFGGWEMPVQYTSITDEHLAVRNAAGIFDISHMGEVTVSGPGAVAFLNFVLTNDICKLASGQGQYTLMCNERGGVVDDLYAYRLSVDVYLLIINASRIDADVAWLQAQAAKFTGGEVNLASLRRDCRAGAARERIYCHRHSRRVRLGFFRQGGDGLEEKPDCRFSFRHQHHSRIAHRLHRRRWF